MAPRAMLPLCDIIPPRRAPVVLFGLLALSLAGVAVLALADPEQQDRLSAALAFAVAAPRLHTAFTASLLHGDAWAIAANALALWIFGETLEDRLGHGRFALVAMAGGVATVLAHAALRPAPDVLLAGGSGLAAAVLGGYFVTYPQSRVLMLTPTPGWLSEVPALIVMSAWWLGQLVGRLAALSATVAADRRLPTAPDLLALVVAFVIGAALTRLLRPPVDWNARDV